MNYYGTEVIEDLLSKVNIVDLIGRYVRLKKRGSSYVGLCPFHSEKTPSFTVSEEKQMYYCFGCHAGGNAITFLINYENMTFVDAVKTLADMFGVTLPDGEISSAKKKEYSERALVFEINKRAANFYYKELVTDKSKIGLEYFLKRGLSYETIKTFGLGYATKGQNTLYKYLKNEGYKDEALLLSGLFIADEKNGIRDRFWNRVMFPILDPSKNVIAFGGRVLGDGLPKYVNSPETKYFNKRKNLYGFSEARKSRDKRYILCEGYMDVISLHQYGFTGAFASLGTALTTGQSALIKTLYRGYNGQMDLFLVYDSDEAGTNAKVRAIPILREHGLVPRVVDLKPYKDPDEFCKNLGALEFEKRLKDAKDGLIFTLEVKEKDYNLFTPAGKNSFIVNEVVGLLSTLKENIERDFYTESLANKYGVSINELKKIVKEKAINYQTNEIIKEKNKESRKPKDNASFIAEKQLLTWMVENHKYASIIKEYITENDFSNDLTKTIFKDLLEFDIIPENAPSYLISKYASEGEGELASFFEGNLIVENSNVNTEEKNLKQVIIKVKENTINRLKNSSDTDFETTMKIMKLNKALQEFKNLPINI